MFDVYSEEGEGMTNYYQLTVVQYQTDDCIFPGLVRVTAIWAQYKIDECLLNILYFTVTRVLFLEAISGLDFHLKDFRGFMKQILIPL